MRRRTMRMRQRLNSVAEGHRGKKRHANPAAATGSRPLRVVATHREATKPKRKRGRARPSPCFKSAKRAAVRRREAERASDGGARQTPTGWMRTRREVFRPSAPRHPRRMDAASYAGCANGSRIAPAAERTDAKSAGTRNGRARTQSNDCGAARDVSVTALSRADVPLGRCGKHADRHTRTQRPTHTAHQRTQPHPHRERRQTHS